ncbi:hypothetical protein [Paenibacillus faecalis]|uniref:hypothetical protein n=1 Tax=Paenibacillus faecalis TaxID=2079532 RepID=UPI000D0F9F70|nr:hypothetical protein [Paenibacillus faecalis]
MKAVFIRDIRRFLSVRLLFLILGCTLFTLSERREFISSYDNFILLMLSEHFYLTFFMVPMFLYILYTHLEDDMDYVLIRIRKYPRYFAVKASAMAVNMSMFVLLQLAVYMLVGIGLPPGSTFPPPDSQDLRIEVLLLFSGVFQYPWQAAAVSVLHMILGLSVLSIFFMMLHHFFIKKNVAFITMGLYFLMVLGMKSKIPGLTRIPFFFINNYIIFMYNLTYPYALWVTYISLAIIAGSIVFFISKYWSKTPSWKLSRFKPKGIASYYLSRLFTTKNNMILAGFIAILALWNLFQIRSNPESTLTDYMIYTFWGHGHGYFNAIDFIMMILMNSIPIYLLALFLEDEKKDHSMMLTIRLRSKWHWGASVFGVGCLFLLVYTLMLTAGSLLIASIGGVPAGEVNYFSGLSIGMNELVIYLSGVKLLELLFQFLLLFTIFLWTCQTTAAFAGILLLYGLYLFPYSWTQYVPVGMSSLVQNENFGTAIDPSIPGFHSGFILLILGGLAIVLSLYVLFAGYKRRFR